jgi:hypothetical protein
MQKTKDVAEIEAQLRYQAANFYVVCEICGEDLGDHRPYFAREHLQKFSEHKKYSVRVKGQH